MCKPSTSVNQSSQKETKNLTITFPIFDKRYSTAVISLLTIFFFIGTIIINLVYSRIHTTSRISKYAAMMMLIFLNFVIKNLRIPNFFFFLSHFFFSKSSHPQELLLSSTGGSTYINIVRLAITKNKGKMKVLEANVPTPQSVTKVAYPDGEITITVTTGLRLFSFKVKACIPIMAVKRVIQRHIHIPLSEQSLSFEGKVLE